MGLFPKKKKITKHVEEKPAKKETKAEPKKEKKERLLDIQVTVGRAHSSPKTYVLNGERTVMDALNLAGLVKKETEIVSVNGHEVEEDQLTKRELEDGDRVTLVRNVEGGKK